MVNRNMYTYPVFNFCAIEAQPFLMHAKKELRNQ